MTGILILAIRGGFEDSRVRAEHKEHEIISSETPIKYQVKAMSLRELQIEGLECDTFKNRFSAPSSSEFRST